MPFKPRTQCATCQLIKTDPPLLDRINRSKAFIPGGEPLTQLASDIGLSYTSVYNHAQKHQSPSAALAKKVRKKATSAAHKQIVAVTEDKAIVTYNNHIEARKALLQKGMEALESGDLRMSMNAIVSLLGQEQKAEENAKDREQQYRLMFAHFASGEAAAKAGRKAGAIEGEIVE